MRGRMPWLWQDLHRDMRSAIEHAKLRHDAHIIREALSKPGPVRLNLQPGSAAGYYWTDKLLRNDPIAELEREFRVSFT